MYKYDMRAMKGGTESGDESTALFEADGCVCTSSMLLNAARKHMI